MNDLVTITIPTKGRKDKLSACLRSIDYPESFVKLGASEEGDIPWDVLNERFLQNSSFQYIFFDPVYIQNYLSRFIQPGSHLLPISDDIVFEPGAIERAVQALKASFPDGDGVVGFDIRNMGEKDKSSYAFMLIGSKFLSDTLKGVPFFKGYRHFYADTELGELASRMGKFISCKEAGVIHFHPSSGHAADATHLSGRQEKWEHDHALYEARKKCLENGPASIADSQQITLTAA